MGCCGCKKTVQTLNIRTINKLISRKFENIVKNITKLDLKSQISDISDFYSLCQLDLPYLENLNLSNNNLSDVSELKSLKVPNLKILDLSYNKLSYISELKFLDVPYLENLNLSNNNISDISELKSLNVPNLKILDLSFNNIEKCDVFLELNFILEELNLIGNEINQFGIFEQAKSLKNIKKLLLHSNDDNETNKKKLSNLQENTNEKIELKQINHSKIYRLATLHLIESH